MLAISRGATLNTGIDIGKAFEQALRDCALSHKEAAAFMFGVPDVSRLSKAISGALSLDDWRIVRMPIEFQIAYRRHQLAAVVEAWLAGFRPPFNPTPAKAALRPHHPVHQGI